eukprot:3609130-Pleurochrysis_carterae.AAC.1
MRRRTTLGAVGERSAACTALGAVKEGTPLGVVEEGTALGDMVERNAREASRWQPLGAVQKRTALGAQQCISRGASASHLTLLCRRGD